jgi:hypothetical protein
VESRFKEIDERRYSVPDLGLKERWECQEGGGTETRSTFLLLMNLKFENWWRGDAQSQTLETLSGVPSALFILC